MRKQIVVALSLLAVITSIAYAQVFTFINSNNGAALNSSSNKTDCLRGHMMAVNANQSNAWDCSSDKCYFHGTTTVAGEISGCKDIPSPNGTPDRLCKITGPWPTWRSVVYNQSVGACNAFAQTCYTSMGANCGSPISTLLFSQHHLTI